MHPDISPSDLSHAVEVIAETNHGISGPKVVSYCNQYASKLNIRIPHPVYPFVASNKRTALLENLRPLPSAIQYALLLQLCDDRTVAGNTAVKHVRQMLVDRYGHLESNGDHRMRAPRASAPPQPPTMAPSADSPVPTKLPDWPPALLPAKPLRPCSIFLSYSHDDEELMNLVRKQLIVYDRQGLINKWWDRKLTAGSTLNGTIQQQLAESDIILLFVSASFLASDYCYDVEMQQALRQHNSGRSVVIPVILRSCGWKAAPMIGGLLALPRDGRPLVLWEDRDEATYNVADGVMKLVAELQARH